MDRNPETCLRIDNDLTLFVGGELEGPAARAVREHLAECGDCRERERSARAAHAALHAGLIAGARPVPGLWAGVRAGLQREGLLKSPLAPVRPLARPWYLRPGVAAAAALLVLVGSFALRQWLDARSTPDQPQPVPPLAGNTLPRPGPTEALPASAGGLRRLGAGERPLAESAERIGAEELQPVFLDDPRNGSSPVGLQRIPWR